MQNFLKPDQILLDAGLSPGMTVADLGSGNGFFTIPASKIVGDGGKVWALDILEEALGFLMSTARMEGCKNIRTQRCDLESPVKCEIPELSCDFVLIGKVLSQVKHPESIMRLTYKILKTSGAVLLIEWKKQSIGIGPSLINRVDKDKAEGFFAKQGFKFVRELEADPYHYVLVFQK